ncbi:DUF4294 domain-containing protein [Saccharicrinis sp. FJH54]|uniref:DUF4294 domain-containing protein n=1 Tax=Saccharicrinis sp. FJH54 TaxID=3344665 RepID=UPI0035D496AE
MSKYKFIFLFIVYGLFLFLAGSKAAAIADIPPVTIPQKDTIYMKILPQIDVYPRPDFKNNRQRRLYYRLIRDVRITLPYAKQAANILDSVNDSLQNIKGEKARKEYLKSVEKDLFSEFEQPLRKLTFSQGRLLIKLVDRECQQNSFELVKLYRGGFSAFFWQGIARIFGANLKAEYDATGSDFQTEQVVRMVERGIL